MLYNHPPQNKIKESIMVKKQSQILKDISKESKPASTERPKEAKTPIKIIKPITSR